MRKFILGAALAAIAFNISADGNLNLAARMLLDTYMENPSGLRKASASGEGGAVDVLFSLAEGHSLDELDLKRLDVTVQIGNVVGATVDITDLEILDASEAVSHVELDTPAEADLAHATVGAQSGVEYAWRGYAEDEQDALPRGFSGKGVVCGIYDKGIDPNHITFMKREDLSTSRVKGLYHFTGSKGGYTEKDPSTFTTDATSETHGTHVLGIMAGGYNGPGTYCEWEFTTGIQTVQCTNTGAYAQGKIRAKRGVDSTPYSGVAYDSDILVGCGSYQQSNMLKMAELVRDYAREHGQPAVLNLSIGNQMGAKDGTSVFCQGIDSIAKDIIVCISASNTGANKSTISRTFSGDMTSFRTLLVPETTSTSVEDNVEIWSATEEPFKVRIFTYDTTTGEEQDLLVCDGPTSTTSIKKAQLGDGFSGALIVGSAIQKQNNRYLLTIAGSGFKATTATRNVGIEVSGHAGQRVDAQGKAGTWRMEAFGIDGFTKGSGEHSVNDFATAKNVFCVGNYTSRQVWGKLSTLYTTPGGGYGSSGLSSRIIQTGDTTQVIPQRIFPSSSYATLVDGRTLPHLAAPGSMIVSAYNRYYDFEKKDASAFATVDGEEYFWHFMNGTSMSTPFFAGVCALWLEANPELDHDGIMDVIAHAGTRQDEHTEAEAARFGYGKVDAYGGLRYILANMSGVGVVDSDRRDMAIEVSEGFIEITGMGNARLEAVLISTSGMKAGSAEGNGSLLVPTDGLAPGMYVLTACSPNSTVSRKIMVR